MNKNNNTAETKKSPLGVPEFIEGDLGVNNNYAETQAPLGGWGINIILLAAVAAIIIRVKVT